jgi:hypothetical protein
MADMFRDRIDFRRRTTVWEAGSRQEVRRPAA